VSILREHLDESKKRFYDLLGYGTAQYSERDALSPMSMLAGWVLLILT
jgi:hypothetical protein